MKSAGNDIVALNAINIQRSKNTRFYSKFLTVAEQALYQQTPADIPLPSFVWLLWSVKEAAYKYLKRHDAGLVFSPIKLVITQVNIPPDFTLTPFAGIYWDSQNANEHFITGAISCGKQQLYFRSKLHHEFVATIVDADEDFENVYWGVQLIEEANHKQQSREVREFTLIKLQCVLGITNLQIKNSVIGYPVVLEGGTPLDIDVSFAHHNLFVAYSFIVG